MIEARTIWTDQDRFLGEASTGHALVMDAGELKTASTPMELVLIALCGCTASDVVGILSKKREPFTGLEVRAQAERLSKEKYCSVSAMLEKTAKIDVEIEYTE